MQISILAQRRSRRLFLQISARCYTPRTSRPAEPRRATPRRAKIRVEKGITYCWLPASSARPARAHTECRPGPARPGRRRAASASRRHCNSRFEISVTAALSPPPPPPPPRLPHARRTFNVKHLRGGVVQDGGENTNTDVSFCNYLLSILLIAA